MSKCEVADLGIVDDSGMADLLKPTALRLNRKFTDRKEQQITREELIRRGIIHDVQTDGAVTVMKALTPSATMNQDAVVAINGDDEIGDDAIDNFINVVKEMQSMYAVWFSAHCGRQALSNFVDFSKVSPIAFSTGVSEMAKCQHVPEGNTSSHEPTKEQNPSNLHGTDEIFNPHNWVNFSDELSNPPVNEPEETSSEPTKEQQHSSPINNTGDSGGASAQQPTNSTNNTNGSQSVHISILDEIDLDEAGRQLPKFVIPGEPRGENQVTGTANDDVEKDVIDALMATFTCNMSQTNFISFLWDALTIIISITDFATNIAVLVWFYQSEQIIFFWISFGFMIAAHIGYLVLFLFHFNIHQLFRDICCPNWYYVKYWSDLSLTSKCIAVTLTMLRLLCKFTGGLLLCILIPFGHLTSFLLYFAEIRGWFEYPWYRYDMANPRTYHEPGMSSVAKFKSEIINKHFGFMIEAFLESFPQSIVQFIAILYLEDTNYIVVFSFILSMISIMSKLLIFSRGIEWKSYIWSWLCVCTDLFGIYFSLSWVCSSNQHIDGAFLGYFNIIGEMWCWKMLIAVVPFFALILVSCFGVGLFGILSFIWEIYEDVYCPIRKVKRILGFLITSTVALGCCAIVSGVIIAVAIVFVGVAALFADIPCFSLLAVALWYFSTDRWDYEQQDTIDKLSGILNFIGNAIPTNNDRVIRILAVNYALSPTGCLGQYISIQQREEALHSVTLQDIRDNPVLPWTTKVLSVILKKYLKIIDDLKDGLEWDLDEEESLETLPRIIAIISMDILFPLYVLSRVVTLFYPYFIIAYLSYHGLWSEMGKVELVTLGCYVGLQAMILLLGALVLRAHWWLWHINPGMSALQCRWESFSFSKMKAVYASMQWTKVMVMNAFGTDIGSIVMQYVRAMQDSES